MIFDFTVKQTEAFDDKYRVWVTEHRKICQLRGGTIGDLYSFRILPTGIGTFVTAHCPCGAEYELSESENF